MSTLDKMWDEFTDRFSRLPVWLPGLEDMAVGDIGVIDERGWQRLYNLKADFSIDYSVSNSDTDPQYVVDSRYAASNSLAASAALGQAIGPVAAAGLNLDASFSASGAFVVRAYNVRGEKVANVGKVDELIAARDARQRFWNRKWIYVTEVATAQPFLILVSASDGARAGVRADASLVESQIGEARIDMGVTYQAAMDQSFVSPNRTPALWRGRWRGSWYSKAMKSLGGSDGNADEVFENFNSPELFAAEADAIDDA